MADPGDAIDLSDSDLAMMDTLGLILDLIVGGNDQRAQQIAGLLDARTRHWEREGKPVTAGILSVMKQRATDPATLERRRQRLALRDAAGRGH